MSGEWWGIFWEKAYKFHEIFKRLCGFPQIKEACLRRFRFLMGFETIYSGLNPAFPTQFPVLPKLAGHKNDPRHWVIIQICPLAPPLWILIQKAWWGWVGVEAAPGICI